MKKGKCIECYAHKYRRLQSGISEEETLKGKKS
jgi:hypothetical protein